MCSVGKDTVKIKPRFAQMYVPPAMQGGEVVPRVAL